MEQPIVMSYHKKNNLPIKYTKNPKIYQETFASKCLPLEKSVSNAN